MAWGLSRTGQRIASAVNDAIAYAIQKNSIVRDGQFCLVSLNGEIGARNRENALSTTLRKVEMLPPIEIRRCLQLLIQDHLGATRDQAIINVARSLGFRSTSSQLRRLIDDEIAALVSSGLIESRDDRLYPVA